MEGIKRERLNLKYRNIHWVNMQIFSALKIEEKIKRTPDTLLIN
jgi:hypothetical protein